MASLKPCSERAQETPVSNPPFPEAGESIWEKVTVAGRQKTKIPLFAEVAYFFLFVYQQNLQFVGSSLVKTFPSSSFKSNKHSNR